MYAIIEDSGKQFKVTTGDRIRIDRPLTEQISEKITFDRVLLVGGDGKAKVGSPAIAGAKVEADVLGRIRGKKIDIQKYNRRKGYHKKQGHRQTLVEVKPETQNGTKVKLRGKGAPVYKQEGTFGDLIVTFHVKLPTGLTDRQRALLREMQHATN